MNHKNYLFTIIAESTRHPGHGDNLFHLAFKDQQEWTLVYAQKFDYAQKNGQCIVFSAIGRLKLNVAPLPTLFSAQILPP